jgi:hypothetical protein
MGARAIQRMRRIENPQLEQLTRIIPFVNGMADVQSFITLKTDQIGTERGGGGRGKRRLANTGFPLEK